MGIAANKKTRNRPGTLFFVTLSVLNISSNIRRDFVNIFDDLVSYCCCLENSWKSSEVSWHIHCFLEFKCKILLVDLREFIVCNFPDLKLDIQSVRNRSNCLKYISKEDTSLYTNIKSSCLNFNYRVFEWAKRSYKFDVTDPFVVEHRFCYRYLNKYFDQYKRNCKFDKWDDLYPCVDAFQNWSLECAVWWNTYYKKYTVKRPALYLYGKSNVGKSSFIESLIGPRNLKYVFYPGVGKFFMQDFDEQYHKVIVFEEFDYQYCCVSMLKRLLEGKAYSYPVKCMSDRVIEFRGPIIFVSNYREITEEAVLNRLKIVHADVPYWHHEKARIPKVEDDSDKENHPETCAISSSSGEESSSDTSDETLHRPKKFRVNSDRCVVEVGSPGDNVGPSYRI